MSNQEIKSTPVDKQQKIVEPKEEKDIVSHVAVQQIKKEVQHDENAQKQNGQNNVNSLKSIQQPAKNVQNQISVDQQVQAFLKKINISISEEKRKEYARYSIQSKKKIDLQNFQEWKNIQEKPKDIQPVVKTSEKDIAKQRKQKDVGKEKKEKDVVKEKKQKIQKKQAQKQKQSIPVPQVKKVELSSLEKINVFFQQQKQSQKKQIKSAQLQLINKEILNRIPILKKHVLKYLQSQGKSYSLEDFKAWIILEQEDDIRQILQEFKKSKNYEKFQLNLQKIRDIITLSNGEKKNLKVSLGAGENKGKTSIKCGLTLKESNQQHLILSIDIKTKKKLQLKTLIEADLKNIYKSSQASILKLCKIHFTETQKSLKIQINLKSFQKQIFGDLVDLMKSKMTQNQNTNIKFQAEILVKNSIRSSQEAIVNKKWIKWMNQGFSSSYNIQGSSQIIKLLVSPLTDIFPSLKIIRSGQVNLKLKNIESVDKFYDKLGINELCEELPSLSTFIQKLIQYYINDQYFPIADYFIKKYVAFNTNIPNEKIQIDLHFTLHQLILSLKINTETCKQLSAITNKLFIQNFN